MSRHAWLLLVLCACGDPRLVGIGSSDAATDPPAQTCTPSGPCRLAEFDAETGRCVERAVGDGAACAGGACLVDARCMAGACIGEAVACDDGNACTLDGCDPARGCIDFGPASACPEPTEPCRARTCDPTTGCGEAIAPDGSPCSAVADRPAGGCIAGVCEPSVTTEACASACWPGCAPGSTTGPLWTYRPADPQTEVLFGAVADEAGNLFWRERGPDGACELLSMNIEGSERFRVASPCRGYELGALLRGSLAVFRDASGVVAHDSRDGQIAWTIGVRPPAGCTRGSSVMAASDDTLFLVWTDGCSNENRSWSRHAVTAARLSDGALRFEHAAGQFTDNIGVMPTIVVDRAGNAYARFANGRYGSAHLGIAGDGTLLWEEVHDEGRSWPVASIGERVFRFWYSGVDYWGGSVIRGRDGEPLPGGYWHAIYGRETEGQPSHVGAGFVLTPEGVLWSAAYTAVTLYDPEGAEVWSITRCALGTCWVAASPILTEQATLLLFGTNDRTVGPSGIVELDASGTVLRSCALTGAGWTQGPFVVHDGTFVAPLVEADRVVGIGAWWVPGLAEAAHGWTSPGGGPARGGAPH